MRISEWTKATKTVPGKRVITLLVITLLAASCGGSVTGPSPQPDPQPKPKPCRQVVIPAVTRDVLVCTGGICITQRIEVEPARTVEQCD